MRAPRRTSRGRGIGCPERNAQTPSQRCWYSRTVSTLPADGTGTMSIKRDVASRSWVVPHHRNHRDVVVPLFEEPVDVGGGPLVLDLRRGEVGLGVAGVVVPGRGDELICARGAALVRPDACSRRAIRGSGWSRGCWRSGWGMRSRSEEPGRRGRGGGRRRGRGRRGGAVGVGGCGGGGRGRGRRRGRRGGRGGGRGGRGRR